MTDIPPDRDTLPDEIPPDYTRLGFRELQRLVKSRELPADGNAVQLVEKLRAWDAEHGKEPDLTVPDADEDDDGFDLLADDDDEPAPEQPPGGEGGASLPSPPDGPVLGTVTSAAPAVVVVAADPDAPATPPAMLRHGTPNMAARDGVVKVGETHTAAEVRAYRREYVIGDRELTDVDHFRYIAETHAAAAAEGLTTKGGTTIGERVGFGRDADGRRTAIYQVPLRRVR
jgi:hypothetical protein